MTAPDPSTPFRPASRGAAVVCGTIIGLVTLCSCGSKSDTSAGAKTGDPEARGPSESAAKPVPAAEPARPSGPAAYFLLRGGGLTTLEKDFVAIDPEREFSTPVASSRGGIYLRTKSTKKSKGALFHLDGGTLQRIDAPAGMLPVEEAPDGTLYARQSAGNIGTYDGDSFRVIPLETIGGTAKARILGMEISGDGTVYVLLADMLLVREDDTWQSFALEMASDKERVGHVSALAVAAGGNAYVATNKRVLRYHEGAVTAMHAVEGKGISAPRLQSERDGNAYMFTMTALFRLRDAEVTQVSKSYVSRIAAAADGTLYTTGTDPMSIGLLKADGSTGRLPPGEDDLPYEAENFTVDDRGRLWVITRYGLVIFAGDKEIVWTPGTARTLPKRIETLVITGNGPELPDLGPPKLIAIKGRFVGKSGRPVKGVKVEICNDVPTMYYAKSPCRNRRFYRATKTGADGTFRLGDIPLGGWSFVYNYRAEKSWTVGSLRGCCGGLQPGDTFDAGDIKLYRVE